jgi:Domain of unknown function (DUF4116)
MPEPETSTKPPSSHASRHAWALEKYGHLLAEALRQDTSAEAREVDKLPEGQIPGRIVTLILENADPTQNKGMTAWLVGQYAQGKLRLEDLGTANETLTMFRRYAQRLEISQRDLGQYPNLAAVWEAVIGFANAEEQHLSGKAQKALERDKAYAESRILRQDPDGFTIAVPLTKAAAKWWGKGTRWCTAADRNNQFWEYHETAPLMVIAIPELGERGKFQLWVPDFWVTGQQAQFMNSADEPVSEEVIAANWSRFEQVMIAGCAQDAGVIKLVPDELRTKDFYKKLLAQNGRALELVHKRLCTNVLYQIAVAQNGLALTYVPQNLRTDAICRIAVAQNGNALCFVPEHLRTEELCRIAVAQEGVALQWVPAHLHTEELCRIAVAQNGEALQWVPGHLHTEKLYRILFSQNGWSLSAVPEHFRTEEICKVVLEREGLALEDVPQDLRTMELVRIAVAHSGNALQHVPEKTRTTELCRIAVAQNGEALRWVRYDLRTEELCKIAVAQNWRALQLVPDALLTEEICRVAVSQFGQALRWVPEHLRAKIKPFVRPKKAVPKRPTWDLFLLDRLEAALAQMEGLQQTLSGRLRANAFPRAPRER